MTRDLPNPETVFAQAIEIESPEERAAFLDQACTNHPDLRREVEKLVIDYFRAGKFLEKPAVPILATIDEPVSERPGTLIGPYKLLQQIGEGGFGVVFMAEQMQPVRRKVALKVLKPGMDTRQVVARFEAERQALAIMDHPNIAKVFDGGVTASGRPYFVMELVKGVPITDFCDQGQLTPRQRLELFIPVCQAVQHAHHKGIIHRDLKPSNVLVTVHDTAPVVKVIDFGVAKALGQELTDKTLFTGFAQMIGTPLYMSPEQAGQSGLDIDTRSDIYSLGVLLYELLTGTTPFDKERFKRAAYDEIRRIIRDEEPPRPSTRLTDSGERLASISAQRHMEPAKLTKLVRGELDWIVMKTLEKDRNRRYETANGFAMDVQRYLNDEPVLACPPSKTYRLRKFARKNRRLLATMGAFAVLLIAATAVSTWQWREADQQRRRAELKSSEADKNLREARNAVDEWFTTISQTTLLEAPGLQPLRKQLLEAALSYYQGLLEQARNNPELRTDLAAAHMRLSIIYTSVDRNDDAVAAILQGLELVEQLIQERPGDTEFPKRLAGFFKTPRELYQSTRPPSEPIKAVSTLRRAAEIWEQFARDNPATVEFQSDLAGIYLLLSALLQNGNDLDQSLAYSIRSRTIWEKLVGAKPGIASYQELLVLNYSENAYLLTRKGRTQESEQLCREAVRYFENLAQEFPTELNLRQSLAMAQNQLAGKLRAAQPAEAERIYRQTLGLLENLVAQSPDNAHYRRELYTTYDNLAEVLQKAEREKEAEEFIGKALAINEKLVLDFPGMPDYRLALARRYSALAERMKESRPLEAEQAYRRALAVHEKLMADFPLVDRYKAGLNESQSQLLNLLQSTGQFQKAEKLCRQAIVRFEKWAAANPSVPEYQTELARSHNRLGILLRNAGRVPDAESEFRKAQELWRAHSGLQLERLKKAAEADPKNGLRWGDLAIAYCRSGNGAASLEIFKTKEHLGYGIAGSAWQWFYIAMAHWHVDHKEEADSWYYRSIDWVESAQEKKLLGVQAEAAALIDLPDPGERSEQAWKYSQTGTALEKQGQKDKAKEAYSKAIGIYEKLLIDFPAVPAYRTKLVELLGKTGKGKDVERVDHEAISRLEKVAADHPKITLYREYLAYSYHALANYLCYEINQKAAAEKVYRDSLLVRERLVADFPASRDYRFHLAHGHLGLAFLFEATGRLPEAEKAYRQALVSFQKLSDQSPNEPAYRVELATYHHRLGILLMTTSRKEEAEQAFRQGQVVWEKLLVEFPAEPAYRTKLIDLLKKAGRRREVERVNQGAILRLEKLAAAHPTNPGHTKELAHLLASVGRNAEALALWEKLVAQSAGDDSSRLYLGNTLWRLADQSSTGGRHDEAEKTLRRALGVFEKLAADFPKNPHYRVEQGFTHWKLGWLRNSLSRPREAEEPFRQALAVYQKLAADYPQNQDYRLRLSQGYNYLAEVLVRQGKHADGASQWDKAAADYTKAIELKPDAWEAWSGRAFVHFSRQQWDRAIADFSKAIDLAPQVHTNWWHRGHVYLQLAQWEKAAANFGKVVDRWPDQAEAWYLRGVAFAQLKQPDKALADLRQAIAKGFNNVEQMKNDPKLALLRTREDFDKLLAAEYAKAIERKPDNWQAWHQRGLAYLHLKQKDKALRDFARASELNPKDAGFHNGLAWSLATSADANFRDAGTALELAKKASALAPKDGLIWNTLGVAHYRTGNWKDAIAALDKSMGFLAGRMESANTFFLAMTHWQLGNKGEARRWYGQADAWTQQHAPHDQELQRFQAEAAALLGKPLPVRLVLVQARRHAQSAQWQQAAASYARAAAAPADEGGHVGFERACVFLLIGDRAGYRRTCAQLLEAQSPRPRGFLVARACNLAPDAVEDLTQAGKAAAAELTGNNHYWALTASAGLHYRAGRFQQATEPLRKCLKDHPTWDGKVLNWLWLSLTCQRLGKEEEARQWFDQAAQWLDKCHGKMPEQAEGTIGLHLHDWLEAQVLRREAEALLAEASRVPND